jgi:hypothetical protein
MRFKAPALACIAFSLLAVPAAAHHSFAMFDQTKVVTLKDATVTEFEWTNPHIWLHLVAVGQDGKQQDWQIELASVQQQAKIGWKADTVKPGDKITVDMNPLKDGTRGGHLITATLASGQKLGFGGNVNNPLGRD